MRVTASSPALLAEQHGEIRWSVPSFDAAIRVAQVGGLVGAQALFLFAALISQLRVPVGCAVLLHVAVALVGAATLRSPRAWPGWFFAVFCLSIALDYAMAAGIGEPLAVLAFALFPPAITVPLTLSRSTAGALTGVLAAAAVVSASISLSHPDWGSSIVLTSAASLVAISVLAAGRMRSLHRLTEQADRVSTEASAARRRAASARTSAHAVAEGMRLLHDTVVNTLGSLASSDAVLVGQSVRARCRQDLDRITRYFTNARDPLLGAFAWEGLGLLPVHRSGMSRAELLRYVAALPLETADALHGCALEALRNATKHSGAESIDVDARIEAGAIVLAVSDRGRGFDGRSIAGRGLAESFFGRARNAGLEAALESSPGHGTTARITCPLDATPTAETDPGIIPVEETITAMRRSIAWVPALPSAGAALVVLLALPSGFPGVHLAFLVIVALALTMRLACGGGRALPAWLAALVVIAVPATVIITLDSADLPGAAWAFPAAVFAILPIVLDATARSRVPYVLTLTLTTLAVTAYAVWGPGIEPDAAAILPFVLAPALCVLAAWHIFDHHIQRIARATADAYLRAHQADLDAARDEAASSSRTSLGSAGLAESLDLLGAIADGTLSPSAPDVRLRCRDEERYLRQILALPVDAPLVSRWLSVALARARSLGVELNLHTEDVHIAQKQTADAFGRVILALIDDARPGSELIVSIIRNRDAEHLFVVGERSDRSADELVSAVTPYAVSVEHIGEQTIVEVVARTEPASEGHRAAAA